MANILFTRKDTSKIELSTVPVVDGQLIFDTSGNGKMYLDNGTNRLEMGGAVTVDATLSKTSTNPIQNKGVAGVILDSLDDIANTTSSGFITGALATKQLNNSLTTFDGVHFRFGKDEDGKYGYIITNEAGADTVIPFKSGGTITYIGRVSSSYGYASINVTNKISNYSEITKDNIFIVPISVSGYMNIADNKVGHSTSGTAYVSYSYESSDGTVGISGLYGRAAIMGNTACTYQIDSLDVYVIQ